MDAADGAEAVLDALLAKGIGSQMVFGGGQAQPVARHEPMQRAHPRAD
jgi:hypothetical protein